MSLLPIAAAALALSGAPAEPGVCRGAAAQPGQVVTGVVLHVIDGERLCLADGPTPDRWTEVTLAKADLRPMASESAAWGKAAVMSAAFGKKLTCTVESVSAGRAVAACALGEVPLGAVLSAPSAQAQAAQWYQPAPQPTGRTLIASR
ncbi:MAG TPA: hypothetical protein VF559_03210 [Caulobacteraceae bacterium]